MPGTIRVSVLEAVDLPEALTVLILAGTVTDGTVKDVIAKVGLGRRQFATESRAVIEGRIRSWDSAFVFFISNLRDNLVVSICDNADQCLTRTSIKVPSIIEKGCRDEFVDLDGGGRLHLIMSFILSDLERRKIEAMRLRGLKGQEQELSKRLVVFQNVQPISKELKAPSVPAATITEVVDDSTHGNKDSQEIDSGPVGFGSTTWPLKPLLMFDYSRAVGLQSRQACQRAEKRSRIWAPSIVNDKFEGRDEVGVPASDVNWEMEDKSTRFVLEAEVPITEFIPFSDRSTPVGQHMRSNGIQTDAMHFSLKGQTLIWNGSEAVEPWSCLKDTSKFECQRLETRPGPGARWAQKTGLETRWTSSNKARHFIRSAWSGPVSNSLKARAKILQLINAASAAHNVCGVDQGLEERHGVTGIVGAVLNKVVGELQFSL